MKQRNNRGARTIPCGTPDVTAVKLLCWPSTTTCCTLLETKLFIQVNGALLAVARYCRITIAVREKLAIQMRGWYVK